MPMIPPTKPIVRDSIFSVYTDDMVTFLKSQYPDISDAEIEGFVKEYVHTEVVGMQDRLRDARDRGEDLNIERSHEDRLWPTAQVVYRGIEKNGEIIHDYGNLTFIEDASLNAVTNQYKNKILSPFGTYYETPDNIPSFIKGMIDTKMVQRSTEKKAMFSAKKDGNKPKEQFHHYAQATIKINMNSMIGGMGADHNFLSDVANFNSVTSISRYFVMTAYAHAERFISSNFYFLTEEQVIQHVITCIQYGPTDEVIRDVISKYHRPIYQPTADDVIEFLSQSLHAYAPYEPIDMLRRLIDSLSDERLMFVYYMSNMKHLVMSNSWFKEWINAFLNPVYSDDDLSNADPSELTSMSGDLIVVLATVCNEIIPKNSKGNSISVYDTIMAAPEIAKQLCVIGKHMQVMFDELDPIFELFMNHDVGISETPEHKQMFRDAVIISDTDSIIFTTKDWVEWYTGSYRMDTTAFAINALVVYWVCKATEYIMFHLSVAMGATNKDVFKMHMKNEFMMPIEILTNLKKHYVTILKIQEGVFYSAPKLDLKGGVLRGSTYSTPLQNFISWFAETLLCEIGSSGEVDISKYVIYTLWLERYIVDSLTRGEPTFLTVVPIKHESGYADADKSVYFNYRFWEEVFGDKYGHVVIPTKCYMLPLTDIRSQTYQYKLSQESPDIYDAMTSFLNTYDKKITRIPLNPLLDRIPPELIPIISYRAIVFANLKPIRLILHSFGINIVLAKTGGHHNLCSDYYGWIDLDENMTEDLKEILSTGKLDKPRYIFTDSLT